MDLPAGDALVGAIKKHRKNICDLAERCLACLKMGSGNLGFWQVSLLIFGFGFWVAPCSLRLQGYPWPGCGV